MFHAPCTASITFRFFRNQLDAVTDDVIRRGSCVFCGEAEETARHIVECALNPLLSTIMELPANEREWLSNPVAETELPPAAIERLSGLHLEIWRCRQHTRREREERSEYEQ